MTPVRFGYNSTSSCSIDIYRESLEDVCRQVDNRLKFSLKVFEHLTGLYSPGSFGCLTALPCLELLIRSNSDPMLLVKYIYGPDFINQLSIGNVSVGIWGNSNWTNTPEWIPVRTEIHISCTAQLLGSYFNKAYFSVITPRCLYIVKVVVTPPATTKTWYSSGTCSSIIVGYDIEVVYGVAFAANNLQHKARSPFSRGTGVFSWPHPSSSLMSLQTLPQVLYVNVCFRTATLTFPPTADQRSMQRFLMTSTVTFVALPQSPWNVQKPTPPLAWPLPADIFYPFVTSGTLRSASPWSAPAVALLTLATFLASSAIMAQH